jgi:hypothetical protein
LAAAVCEARSVETGHVGRPHA